MEGVAAVVGQLPAGTEEAMGAVTAAAMVLLAARATPTAGAVTPSARVAAQRSPHRVVNIAPIPRPGGFPARGLAMRIRPVG